MSGKEDYETTVELLAQPKLIQKYLICIFSLAQ
jgi:hypothetical protein